MMAGKPKIALVLGAGSARGLAHLGVLQVLVENSIPIDFLVGSSMGALVAAAYASGTDIYMLAKMTTALNYSIFWDVQLPRMGFILGKKIESFVHLITKGQHFKDLNPPVAVVATDVETGEKVVLTEGLVSQAVRASISIPGIFTPVRYNGRLLVDGAVSERLPISVARAQGADLVIAVDVTFAEGKVVKINNTLDVILQSIEILERQIFEKITRSQADILIQPAVTHIGSKDFDRAEECIALGRGCAEAMLPQIKAAIIDYGKPDSPAKTLT